MSLEYKHRVEKDPKQKNKFKTYLIGPSLTRQEFVKSSDINRVVDKYLKTGQLPYKKENLGMYADVSEIGDFKSSLDFVITAKEHFNALNVHVRKRFQNDPDQLLDFLKDDNNYSEAVKLGLIDKTTKQVIKDPIIPDVTLDEPLAPTKGTSKDKAVPPKGGDSSSGVKTED